VVLLKATSLFSLIGMSAHMAIGRPDSSPRYQRLRCTTVKITTSAPVTPNIDGDPGTATTAMTLSVLPKAVRIIVS
jgi:diacylglycerol kinase family enzyme